MPKPLIQLESPTDDSDSPIRAGYLCDTSTPIETSFFRGDNCRPKQAFEDGIKARGTNTDLWRHANPVDEYFFGDSAYVSTSTSPEIAKEFPKNTSLKKLYLYDIRSARNPINIVEILMPDAGIKIDYESFFIYAQEQERVFSQKIHPWEIRGAWEVEATTIMTEDPVTFYRKFPFLPPEAVQDLCYEQQRTITKQFYFNRYYEQPYSQHGAFKVVTVAGALLTGASLALDVAGLCRVHKQDTIIGNYDKTHREGTRIVGSWMGAFTMGATCAENAAIWCSPFGPVGSATCGFLGGIGGSVLGYYGGSTLATRIFDLYTSDRDKRNNRISSFAHSSGITHTLSLEQFVHAGAARKKQTIILLNGPDPLYEMFHGSPPYYGFKSQNPNADVIPIGNGKTLLTDQDINQLHHTIRTSKNPVTLVIDGHGEYFRGQHYIWLKEDEDAGEVTTKATNSNKLFRDISDDLQGRSIDVLFMPCEGGTVNKSIRKILPKNSRFVSLSSQGHGTSGFTTANFYNKLCHVSLSSSGNSVNSEKLLLNYLSNYSASSEYPTLVVTMNNNSYTHDDLFNELSTRIGTKFSSEEESVIYKLLRDYTDYQRIGDILSKIENYRADKKLFKLTTKEMGLALAISQAASKKSVSEEKVNRVRQYLSKDGWRSALPTYFDHVKKTGTPMQSQKTTTPKSSENSEADSLYKEVHALASSYSSEPVGQSYGEELQKGRKKFQETLSQAEHQNPDETRDIENKLEKLGVSVDDKLKELLKENGTIRQQLNTVYTYINAKAAREKQKENVQGVMDAAGFVGELGRYLGNQDVYRMGTLAQAGIKIANNLTALQGALSLSSLTSISGIGMSVLSILGAFAEQGPNINQIMLDAIQSIALQLESLRREMHERLDKIDSRLIEINLRIISGFCDMQHQHKTMIDMLKDIRDNLRKEQDEVKNILSTLNREINNISDMQNTLGRQQRLGEIFKIINQATGIHTLDAKDFKKLYSDLISEISTLHASDTLLVGKKSADPVSVVDHLEKDKSNLFAAEFNINALCNCVTSNTEGLINPAVFSWQLMGMMALMKRFYEQKERPTNLISHPELKALGNAAEIGEKTERLSKSLRKEDILLRLHQDYLKAGQALSNQLKKYVAEEEKRVTKELNQACAQSVEYSRGVEEENNNQNSSVFDTFKEQEIPINPTADKRAFTGLSYNHHNNFGKAPGYSFTAEASYVKSSITDYVAKGKQSIAEKSGSYVKQARSQLGKYNSQFNYFSASKLELHYHYAFTFPQKKGDPILPLPTNYRISIPPTIQKAEWPGGGHVSFQYRTEELEEKEAKIKDNTKKQNFILEAFFITDTQKYLISRLVTPYEPGIYSNDNGYDLCLMPNNIKNDIKPEQCKLYLRERNNRIAYTVTTPKGEIVRDIELASPPAPKPFTLDSLNKLKEQIIEVTSKAGHTHDNRIEALWWWWVGGKYCRGGEQTLTEVHRAPPTSQHNYWTQEAYIPKTTEYPGKCDEIKLNKSQLHGAKEEIFITEKSDFIQQLKQKVNAKQKEFKDNLVDKLKKEIANNTESALGKAFIAYSYTFYMLKSALSIAFGEANLNKIESLKYFYDATVPSNRSNFLSFLASNRNADFSFIELFDKNLKTIDQLSDGLKKISTATLDDSYLTVVLKTLKDLINWYKLRAVDENQLCSSRSVQEMRETQLEIFECMTRALLSCGSDVQNQVLNKTLKEMSKKGRTAPSNIFSLLQPSSDSKSMETDFKHSASALSFAGYFSLPNQQQTPQPTPYPTPQPLSQLRK